MTDSNRYPEEDRAAERGELCPAPLDLSPAPLARRRHDLARTPSAEQEYAPRPWVEVEVLEAYPSPARRWLARGAAAVGICLLWASGLGVATVWPRWNRTQMLQAQMRDEQARVTAVEERLQTARLAVGTDRVAQARDRVLSADQVRDFLRAVRGRAGALGLKVIALEHAERVPALERAAPVTVRGRLVTEGSFSAVYELLRYLESRRVFVAVHRAEMVPTSADGRLKAALQFEFLAVPARPATGSGEHV
jgi:hypothetical protein